jgi:hypothetical protein
MFVTNELMETIALDTSTLGREVREFEPWC